MPRPQDPDCANCECACDGYLHPENENLQYWIDQRVNAAWTKCYSCFTCPALLGCELNAGSGACVNKRLELDPTLAPLG